MLIAYNGPAVSAVPTCLLLAPAGEGFFPVREVAEKVAGRNGIRLIQVNADEGFQEFVPREVLEAVRRSDMVIGDITGLLPNVLFELGAAHALRKELLIVAQKAENIPLDLASQRVVFYKPGSDQVQLESFMDYWMRESLSRAAAAPASRITY